MEEGEVWGCRKGPTLGGWSSRLKAWGDFEGGALVSFVKQGRTPRWAARLPYTDSHSHTPTRAPTLSHTHIYVAVCFLTSKNKCKIIY